MQAPLPTTEQTINTVAIVGGTHGNEFSGIYLLRQWQKSPEAISRPSFTTETVFANPRAFDENRRYLDADLNRQFKTQDLANTELTNYEQSRAKAINAQLGPKGNPRIDLVIDLHNTTSAMGPTLLIPQLPESDPLYTMMAAYVQMKMPSAVIIFDEDCLPAAQHHLLCTLGKFGVIIEVGPQPQSVLRQDILEEMEEMTRHILDFTEHYNRHSVPALPAHFTAYRYLKTLSLPMDEQGERIGMVHRNVQDRDFAPIHPGEAIFKLFSGEEIVYDGDSVVYPSFINEAAYYDNNLAMSLSEKVTVQTFADGNTPSGVIDD